VGRLFGTDGVRGRANVDLTAELALDLSVAAAHVLGDAGAFEGHRPVAVVGRDPRASGEFLEAAVVAGLASAGVDVLRVGVLPTPAVAYLTAQSGADLGVMLSASHNPMPDNGIKFFARGGHKLADDLEDAVEQRMGEQWPRPTGAAVGRVHTVTSAAARYVEHVLGTSTAALSPLRVVVDCANGAAAEVAPQVLQRAGAEVIAIHAHPDGTNINDGCGSTHLADLQAAVIDHRADLGIAFDGDADRCLAVDSSGQVVDGDQIMAVIAVAMHQAGTLTSDTLVATVMSNLGLKLAMQAQGIRLIETAVGDRYVLAAMRAGGYNLGGEQSGHVVMLDHATTGDGTLTALHLLARLAETGASLTELAGVVVRLPQVLVNVPDVDKARAATDEGLADAVRQAQAQLGERGRVLLRPSGTEALVRVMVEAATSEQAQQIADDLATVVRQRLGVGNAAAR
jgi:phosphoglucosamine mutase